MKRQYIYTAVIVLVFIIAVISIFSLPMSSEVQPPKTEAEIAAEKRIAEKEVASARKQAEDAKAEEAAWQASPAGKLCAKHTDWQKEECDKVAANRVWIGISYDMLVYLRGSPDRINPSNYGQGTQYQYCWDGYTPSCFYDRNNDGKLDAYN